MSLESKQILILFSATTLENSQASVFTYHAAAIAVMTFNFFSSGFSTITVTFGTFVGDININLLIHTSSCLLKSQTHRHLENKYSIRVNSGPVPICPNSGPVLIHVYVLILVQYLSVPILVQYLSVPILICFNIGSVFICHNSGPIPMCFNIGSVFICPNIGSVFICPNSGPIPICLNIGLTYMYVIYIQQNITNVYLRSRSKPIKRVLILWVIKTTHIETSLTKYGPKQIFWVYVAVEVFKTTWKKIIILLLSMFCTNTLVYVNSGRISHTPLCLWRIS